MGSSEPLRIDLFDDEIEAIRRFDPETQRSLDALESVQMLPAREVPLDAAAVKDFRRRYRTRFEGDPTKSVIYRGVSEGLAPAGVEFYQPLFFESTATLLDYLPRNAVIVQDAALPEALARSWAAIATRYEDRRHDIERPLLPPQELFIEPAPLSAALTAFACVTLDAFKADTELTGEAAEVHTSPLTAPRELRIDIRAEQPFAPLDSFPKAFDGRVLIAADSAGRREVLQECCAPTGTRWRWCPTGRPRRRRHAPGAYRGAGSRGTHAPDPRDRGHFRGAAVRGARPPGTPSQARRGSGSDPA
jgi:transcription-repair coupling factor (superfamily II helicase)